MSPAWKVADFNSDLHRVSDLISVICELRFELPVGEDDNRVDSLLWVAREMVEGLVAHDDGKKGGAE
ncbi:hypothetical protein [Aquamicrobium defluvii]|uniref:Uncharacterized protein n=1 Tax=Aquamicrobium defluvii TaxID=69279 RepID=A0A011TX19_9HYPH|nr:hypothetical protein [Aquamicrobium defluvii]EXL08742.1 hypothetical protein BG36_03615 [Aquamicrobium defluvii]EZQ14891.1 hypothetical protein CF98_14785 [Halopseudomonas bauzanensis]